MSPDEARSLLELSPLASELELQNAYRSMLRVWHPDRFQEGSQLHEAATARTRRLIEAFRVLSERGVGATDADAPPPCPASGLDPYGVARSPLHLTEPTPEKTRGRYVAPGRPSWRVGAALIAASVVTVVGVGVALSVAEREAASSARETLVPSPAAEAAGATSAVGTVVPVARFSMAIGSFRDLRRARALVGDVAARAPEVWTTIAPVEVKGTVFYRVLVGMSADLPELERSVEPLRTALGEDSGAWLPREAGLTFCVSESGSLEDARATMERARELGIETFALGVASPRGDGAVRVCAGSYEGPEEGAYLKRALEEAGFVVVPRARSGEPLAREPSAS